MNIATHPAGAQQYVLDKSNNPIPADLATWAAFFSSGLGEMSRETVGRCTVSTVFLGVRAGSNLVLWETRVLEQQKWTLEKSTYHKRSSTYEGAVAAHATALAWAKVPRIPRNPFDRTRGSA